VISNLNGQSLGEAVDQRRQFALEICPSATCHCRDITLVEVLNAADEAAEPAMYVLNFVERLVQASSTTMSRSGYPSAEAIAAAIPEHAWHELGGVFFAAKAMAFAAIDTSNECAEFPFDEVERRGILVPICSVIPFAPRFLPPADDSRDFGVSEQYCVRPRCDCTESIIELSVSRPLEATEAKTSPTMRLRAEPYVDFYVDWQNNTWRIAGQNRQLTATEMDLRDRLVAANPNLLSELRRRHEVMRNLYRASANQLRPISAPFLAGPRISRNEPCPCGSGKKYKRCCLAKATDRSPTPARE